MGTLSNTFLKTPFLAFFVGSVRNSSVIIAEIFYDTAEEIN